MTLVGAGNIAKCGQVGAAATALLLDSIPGTVFAAGTETGFRPYLRIPHARNALAA